MNLLKIFKILFYSTSLTLIVYLYSPINYLNPELKEIGDIVLLNFEHPNCLNKLEDLSLKLHFSPLPGDTVGLCLRLPGGNRVILIDKYAWESDLTEREKFFVIMHEMGHCLLYLNHSSDSLNYMYYTITNLSLFEVYNQFQRDLHEFCSKNP